MRFLTAVLFLFTLVSTSAFGQLGEVLMIPDSNNDTVDLYDPFDGTLLVSGFIVGNGELTTPINAIPSGRGSIFLSDQLADAVLEYDLDGNLIGTVIDSSDGVDNVRGIEVYDGKLYASIGSGALAGTIQVYDLEGGQSTFAMGLDPFDVFFRDEDILVACIDNEDIAAFDFDGAFLGPFHDSDGVNGIDFPEQINLALNGDVLVGGFSSPAGVYRYDAVTGIQVDYFDVGTGVRGVHSLGNGQILYTSGSGVFSLDPVSGQSTLLNSGGSYRFVERINLSVGCTTASSLDVFRGIQLDGDLSSTFESDDNYVRFNPGFTVNNLEAPVWLIFDGNIGGVPDSLAINIESNAGTPNITLTIDAFDWGTNSFTEIHSEAETFDTDSVIALNLTANIAEFVSDTNEVRTRIGWRKTGFTLNFPWEIRLDQMIWKTN